MSNAYAGYINLLMLCSNLDVFKNDIKTYDTNIIRERSDDLNSQQL